MGTIKPKRGITALVEWIEERLDKGAWFRRAYLILAMWMNVRAMLWATEFASSSDKPGLEIAAIIAAVAAIPSAVMAHAFQVYLTSRNS